VKVLPLQEEPKRFGMTGDTFSGWKVTIGLLVLTVKVWAKDETLRVKRMIHVCLMGSY
jgi:hypothetical protein